LKSTDYEAPHGIFSSIVSLFLLGPDMFSVEPNFKWLNETLLFGVH